MVRRAGSQRFLHLTEQPFKSNQLLQFVETTAFTKGWQLLCLDSDDLLELQHEIMFSPAAAPVIKGTGGLRKIRFAPAKWKKGKSGAVRVCFVYFETVGIVLLVVAYSKNEKDDLTADERAKAKALIARQRAAFAKRVAGSHTPRTNAKH